MTSAYQTPPMVQGGRPPTASVCQGDGVELPAKEASMEQATTIGLDIAKHVFQVHGACAVSQAHHAGEASRFSSSASPVRRRDGSLCRRAHWAREIGKLGHHVRLIAPA